MNKMIDLTSRGGTTDKVILLDAEYTSISYETIISTLNLRQVSFANLKNNSTKIFYKEELAEIKRDVPSYITAYAVKCNNSHSITRLYITSKISCTGMDTEIVKAYGQVGGGILRWEPTVIGSHSSSGFLLNRL